jgi:endonuclease/exonuclease/phosphatase family metal-dependent hydrolase
MVRLATWNVEWFSALFDQDNRLLVDDGWSRRHDVTRGQQADAIARVMRSVDADLMMVIEAPNTGHRQDTVSALQGFAAAYGLRQRQAVMGFANGTEQEIAALFDPDRISARHDPQGQPYDGAPDPAPRFDGEFRLDVDVDGQPDIHRFSKPPLELDVQAGGRNLRLIGVHTKSKAPHGARDAAHELAIAIANRRKQLAECVWLRGRIDAHLDAGDDLVVLGDFNDGPGLDDYEALFGRSGIEVALGVGGPPERLLAEPHAKVRLDPRQGWTLSTARFWMKPHHTFVNALLDYVMLSPGLAAATRPRWRIWHPFDNPDCYGSEKLRRALLMASDHFPVSVDLRI